MGKNQFIALLILFTFYAISFLTYILGHLTSDIISNFKDDSTKVVVFPPVHWPLTFSIGFWAIPLINNITIRLEEFFGNDKTLNLKEYYLWS